MAKKEFSFKKRTACVDWKKIASIDVNQIEKNVDFNLLQQNIGNITFCNIENEMDGYTDPKFIKLYKMSQFIIEYLLHSQDYLSNIIVTQETKMNDSEKITLLKTKEIDSYKTEVKNYKTELKRRKTMINNQQHLIKNGTEQYFKCSYCQKAFFNDSFLKSHLNRRHPEYTKPLADVSDKIKNLENNLCTTNNELETFKKKCDSYKKVNSDLSKQHEKDEQIWKDDIRKLKKSNKDEIINFKDQMKMKDLQIENIENLLKSNNNNKKDSNLGIMISDENYEIDQIKQNMDLKIKEMDLKMNYQEKFWNSKITDMQKQHSSEVSMIKQMYGEMEKRNHYQRENHQAQATISDPRYASVNEEKSPRSSTRSASQTTSNVAIKSPRSIKSNPAHQPPTTADANACPSPPSPRFTATTTSAPTAHTAATSAPVPSSPTRPPVSPRVHAAPSPPRRSASPSQHASPRRPTRPTLDAGVPPSTPSAPSMAATPAQHLTPSPTKTPRTSPSTNPEQGGDGDKEEDEDEDEEYTASELQEKIDPRRSKELQLESVGDYSTEDILDETGASELYDTTTMATLPTLRTETLSFRENKNTKILAQMKNDPEFVGKMRKQLSLVLDNRLKEFGITQDTERLNDNDFIKNMTTIKQKRIQRDKQINVLHEIRQQLRTEVNNFALVRKRAYDSRLLQKGDDKKVRGSLGTDDDDEDDETDVESEYVEESDEDEESGDWTTSHTAGATTTTAAPANHAHRSRGPASTTTTVATAVGAAGGHRSQALTAPTTHTESAWTTNASVSSFDSTASEDVDASSATPTLHDDRDLADNGFERTPSNRIVLRQPTGENVSKLTREIDAKLMLSKMKKDQDKETSDNEFDELTSLSSMEDIKSETLSSSYRTSKWGKGLTAEGKHITSSQATLSDFDSELN